MSISCNSRSILFIIDFQQIDMDEINKKLRENGINPITAKEDEKLRVLFQLYRRSESNLQTAKLDMEKLQHDQTQEIKEVGSLC